MAEETVQELPLDSLELDLENPRFGLIDARTPDEALAILAARADLRELWNSINERGFERYEPLVAFKRIEGNCISSCLNFSRRYDFIIHDQIKD